MDRYQGIIIRQSLRDSSVLNLFEQLATRRIGSWLFFLVQLEASALDATVKKLQNAMVEDDEWYAHFFSGDRLIVVFREAVFFTTVSPEGWEEVVSYGLTRGIPLKQLDFEPRTNPTAAAFFNLGS